MSDSIARALKERECNERSSVKHGIPRGDAQALAGSQVCWNTLPLGPPLAARFRRPCGSLVAVASEDGSLKALSANAPHKDAWDEDTVRVTDNAVFSVDWLETHILLASGSQAVHLLAEREGSSPVAFGRLDGHAGSVKDVRLCASSPCVAATASRDGCVKTWDLRLPQHQRCTGTLTHPHLCESKPKKIGAVTSVCWLAGGTALATGGDKDGLVKVWDTRKQVEPIAAVMGPCGSRPRGVASLFAHPVEPSIVGTVFTDGATATIDCCSSNIRLPHFLGSGDRSFYVQGGFSCDGSLLASGDGGNSVAVWEADASRQKRMRETWPVAVLSEHCAEATALDWSPVDPMGLVTCSDDYTVRLWSRGHARKYQPPLSHQPQRLHEKLTKVAQAPRETAQLFSSKKQHQFRQPLQECSFNSNASYSVDGKHEARQGKRKQGHERSISSYFC